MYDAVGNTGKFVGFGLRGEESAIFVQRRGCRTSVGPPLAPTDCRLTTAYRLTTADLRLSTKTAASLAARRRR